MAFVLIRRINKYIFFLIDRTYQNIFLNKKKLPVLSSPFEKHNNIKINEYYNLKFLGVQFPESAEIVARVYSSDYMIFGNAS